MTRLPFVTSASLVASMLCFAASAHAEGPPAAPRTVASIDHGAPAESPAPAPGAAEDTTAKPPPSSPSKSFSLELNPLAAGIGRYSIQAEWLPALHHAIVLNPHFDHVNADVSVDGSTAKFSESFTGFGGELGYRYYTGSKGMNGFYVGPSFLVGAYSASADGGTSVNFHSFGAALDIGGQAVIGPGIVIGGGFGLQYTSVNKDFNDLPLTASVLAGGGVRPRFLFSVGYAF